VKPHCSFARPTKSMLSASYLMLPVAVRSISHAISQYQRLRRIFCFFTLLLDSFVDKPPVHGIAGGEANHQETVDG
jgi:hypothetical protein